MLNRYTTGPRINSMQNIMESFLDVKFALVRELVYYSTLPLGQGRKLTEAEAFL